jgi:hypothetical protein
MLYIVVARVTHALKALGNVDPRKSHQRDDTTDPLELLVYDWEETYYQTHDLRLHQRTFFVLRIRPTGLGCDAVVRIVIW